MATQQRVLTGDKELDRALKNLGRKARSIAGTGARAGLKEISDSIKQQVPTKVRPSFAHRLKRRKGASHIVSGKAGAAVGKRNKKRARNGRPGLGISKENIHWFLMGTGPRYTGSRKSGTTRKRTNFPRAYRGIMPAIYRGVVRRGASQAKPRVLSAMQRAMWKRVEKEVAKTR